MRIESPRPCARASSRAHAARTLAALFIALSLGAGPAAPLARADVRPGDDAPSQEPPLPGESPDDRFPEDAPPPPPLPPPRRDPDGVPDGDPDLDRPPREGGRERVRLGPDEPPPSEVRHRRDDSFIIAPIWLPALSLWSAKEDKKWITHVRSDNTRMRTNLNTGDGAGVRIAFGTDYSVLGGSVGALYLWSHHHDRVTESHLDVHVLMGEFEVHGSVPRDADVRIRIGAALGLGGFVYDFPDRSFHDTGGVAMGGRAFLGVYLFDHVIADVSCGFLWLGYPSELLGTGAYVAIMAGVAF